MSLDAEFRSSILSSFKAFWGVCLMGGNGGVRGFAGGAHGAEA